jgi:protein CpxP
MKTMKWIATIIIVVGMATSTYAQAGGTPADQAKQLQAELKLTELQTTKITNILQQITKEQANDKTVQSNFKNWQNTNNKKAMIDYILKQMDANASRIEQVLTVEQKKTFQEMLEKRRDGLRKMEASY